MGTRGQGSGIGRVRRLGPVVAAVVGATAVGAAAAVAGRRHRREAGPRTATAPPPAADALATPSASAARSPAGPAIPADATARVGARTAPPAADPPAGPPAPAVGGDALTPDPIGRVTTTPPTGSDDADPPLPRTPSPSAPAAGVARAGARPPVARAVPTGAPPGADAPPRSVGAGRPRRSRLVGLVAGGLLVGAVAGLAAATGGDDRPADTAAGPGAAADAPATTATTVPPVTTDQAFAAAARRLTTAGSFTYTGTVSATDVSHVRPMFWLAVSSTVEGQVATATGRLHEVAVTSDGRAAETVTAGSDVWGRRASTVEGLAGQAYEAIPGLSGPESGPDGDRDGAGQALQARGAALLPAWLASATGPTDAGPDEEGRRRFQATIPAGVLGEIERERQAVDATVVLTLDAAGAPVRVEITSAPDGPPLHLVLDIGGLGSPVAIEPPGAIG